MNLTLPTHINSNTHHSLVARPFLGARQTRFSPFTQDLHNQISLSLSPHLSSPSHLMYGGLVGKTGRVGQADLTK